MADIATSVGAKARPAPASYAAFISYSHADTEMCDRLHRRLEAYQVPHSLVGRAGAGGKVAKRLGKFFRDRVDLGAHHDLGAEIRQALDASAALIVLCSPASAGSKYVEEEIRYFKSRGRADQVYAAIIAGEPHAAGKPGLSAGDECFPRALVYRLDAGGAVSAEPEPAEPIAADLREKKDGLENGSLKLIAGLLDIGLDDLVQREKQAERRRRRQAYLVSGVMGVLALGAAGAGVLAYLNGEMVKVQAGRIEDNNVALSANKAEIEAKNADLARQLRQNQSLTTRITSVVGEITGIAEKDDTVPERLLFLSFGARLGISAAALNSIFEDQIGNATQINVTNYGGSGYCMGFQYCDHTFSTTQMQADWEHVLPPADIARLSAVWGIKARPGGKDWDSTDPNDLAIQRAQASVGAIKIGRRDAMRVFGRSGLPLLCEDVRRMLPDADNLPPDSFGALVYLVFSFGPKEVARMVAAVASGKYPDMAAGIRALGKEQASGAPSPRIAAVIVRRSEEQALLYERGLQAQAAPPAPGAVGAAGKTP